MANGGLKLDAAFLADVGLEDLPSEEGNLMLSHVYETLENRVGFTLASSMTDRQLDEFELLIDEGDEDGALAWLERNVPDYRSVVAEELDLLRAELRQIAPTILSLSGITG